MKTQNKKKIFLFLTGLSLIIIMFLFIKFPHFFTEIWQIFANKDTLETTLKKIGFWGPLFFVFIQTIQVILAPIPGNISALAGGALWGPVNGFFLSSIGLLFGSLIAFYLARNFGQPLVLKFVDSQTFERYNKIFFDKYIITIFLIFLLPFFPDDALCFLAGLSALPVSLFLILVLLGRMPGMLIASLVGAGTISLSVKAWGLIIFSSVLFAFLVIRYGRNFEYYFYKKISAVIKKNNDK